MKLKDIERQAILEALYYTNWHITLVAKRLGISRATLYRKIKLYGIGNPIVNEVEQNEEI